VDDLPLPLAKSMSDQICKCEVPAQTEENYLMNARPQVREILIAKKMKRWILIAQHPFVDRSCPPSRARKNYARLCTKYPEIMRRIGLHEFSAF
jgi:hypothetical protein